MATRRKPTLLAQGKPRTARRQRAAVAGAALRPGGRRQQVPGDVPGAGRRGRAVEAGAATGELRGRGAQDLRPGRGCAGHRAGDARRRRRPGLPDDPHARRGVPQGQHRARQATPHDGGARVSAQRPHPADHRRRAGDEVAGRAQPQGDGEGHRRRSTPHRGREDLRGQLAAMRKLAWRLGWLDRSIDPLDGLEIGRATVLHGATTQYVDPRLRPETRQVRAMAAAADKLVRTRRHRPADDPPPAVRHQDPRRGLRRPTPRRAERAPRDRRLLRARLCPRQRLMDHPASAKPGSAAR